MAETMPKLVTTRYTRPSTYIGQLVFPSAGNLNLDARMPTYIGRGSRFAKGSNTGIRRSYVLDESLAFPGVAPFTATLAFESDGVQGTAVLKKMDGTEIRQDLWKFEKDIDSKYTKLTVSPEIYESSVTYILSYQSLDRVVKDPVPITELRQILLVGSSKDTAKFQEYLDYFIDMGYTGPTGDAGNTNASGEIDPTLADPGNSGGGAVAIDVSATYTHDYNRYYTVECTSIAGTSGSFVADFDWSATPVGGGNSAAPGVPLNVAQAMPNFQALEVTPSSQVVELEYGVKVKITFTGTNFVVGDKWTFNALGPSLFETSQTLTNTNQYLSLGEPAGDAGNTGTGDIALSPDADYTGSYNSNYKIQAYAVTNTPATGDITAVAKAAIVDGEFFTIDDTEFEFDAAANGVAAGRVAIDISADTTDIEVADSMRTAINGATSLGITAGGSTAVVTLTADLAGTAYNYAVTEAVSDAGFLVTAMTGGNRTADISWQEYGHEVGVSGIFTADESNSSTLTQTLNKGVKVDVTFGTLNFIVDDFFVSQMLVPRVFTTIKDNRTYTFTTTAVTASSATAGSTGGTFVTNTREGSFGSFIATSTTDTGGFTLPGNIKLFARNMYKTVTTGFENRHVVNDVHTFAVTNDETINWSLTSKTSEQFLTTELLTDTTGLITGVVGASYVILNVTPVAGSAAVTSNSVPISFSSVANSPFIYFLTKPTATITVSYESKGEEPDPGQLYYFTANYLRGSELYNVPIRILSLDEGRKLLGPSEVDNHLYIMNEIAWKNLPFGMYYIQVKDLDDDGVYTKYDFNQALLASETKSDVTDRIVLSNFNSVSDQLSVNVKANDPFEARLSLDWFGLPTGTTIGDIDTPDSIVYTAKKTLQVFGNSPSHGSRILSSSTWCKTTIVLENFTSIQVTLDGSFVSGALAARVAGFNDPATTLLRKNVFGFDDMEVFSDKENLLLGAAGVVYFTKTGPGVFQIEEDITVDTLAIDFSLISGMTQKQFVTKVFARELDNQTISFVVPSGAAGVALVQSASSSILLGLLGRGLIAPYQDEVGSERKFSPSLDVIVTRDTADPTLYHLLYRYFLRYPVKRVFGLYTVSAADFGRGLALQE